VSKFDALRAEAALAIAEPPCAHRFPGGGTCKVGPAHVIHDNRWPGPEENHEYDRGRPQALSVAPQTVLDLLDIYEGVIALINANAEPRS
jgi:hypothetical protein